MDHSSRGGPPPALDSCNVLDDAGACRWKAHRVPGRYQARPGTGVRSGCRVLSLRWSKLEFAAAAHRRALVHPAAFAKPSGLEASLLARWKDPAWRSFPGGAYSQLLGFGQKRPVGGKGSPLLAAALLASESCGQA